MIIRSTKYPGYYPFQQLIGWNPPIAESPCSHLPSISNSALIGPHSIVIGDVTIDEHVFIGFHNVIRADSTSAPYYCGPYSNIQDFVMIHCHPGQSLAVHGKNYSVYIADRVSILHHSALHGPLYIGSNTFVGQRASISHARIGSNCMIMHGAVIANDVVIAEGRYVEPGQVVSKQEQADALPPLPESLIGQNAAVVNHYYRLAHSYRTNTPYMI